MVMSKTELGSWIIPYNREAGGTSTDVQDFLQTVTRLGVISPQAIGMSYFMPEHLRLITRLTSYPY